MKTAGVEEAIKAMRSAWHMTMQRCYNPSNRDFKYYGGRGIKVAERWHVFDNYLEDMGLRPEGMTLERVDNDGPYSAENCRWASRKDQSRNQRWTLTLTYKGETLTLAEWAERTGIPYSTLKARARRLRYTPEQCIEKPVKCGTPLPGQPYSKQVLTREQVLRLRAEATTAARLKEMAAEFGVSTGAARHARDRVSFKEIKC